MAQEIAAPKKARAAFQQPVIHGLLLVTVHMKAPIAKDAIAHNTTAAMNAALRYSVQAKGMTDGQAPMMKKLKYSN